MTGSHVLVTGGSRGLGLAFVRGCLDWGYAVSTCSRTQTDAVVELVKQHPGRCQWVEADLGEPGAASRFVLRAVKGFPDVPLYGLVNSAGITGEGIHSTFPMTEVRRIVEVNLIAAIEAAREFLRLLLPVGRPGRIVNISSIIGIRGYTGLATYSATKAGIDGLTRALAREWGRTGTTVNSIAPGYLETEMSAALNLKQRHQIVRRTPMERLGTVDDVVPVLRFLLSEGAQFVTGQTLVVDGGISA